MSESESSDSQAERDVRSPWVATDDRKEEIKPRERELFARAQEEMYVDYSERSAPSCQS